MTLPYERTRAVLSMRDWLLFLAAAPGRINKRAFRRELHVRLRHYPTAEDLRHPAQAFDSTCKLEEQGR